MTEVILLGAGIAGLAAADQLVQRGFQVTVIEASGQCGGTHRSQQIGAYTFDAGSIFYEENARLLQLADGLKTICPTVMRHHKRIAPNGAIVHYPLEPREVLKESPWRIPAIFLDMAWSRLSVKRDGTLSAVARKRMGRSLLHDTGLYAYITRFHHASPKEIDEAFFFHRMDFIERSTRLYSMYQTIMRTLFTRKVVNAHLRRPLFIRPYEGFDHLFNPIRMRLEAAGVRFVFSARADAISRSADGFTVETSAGVFAAPALVSTIPLNRLHHLLFGEPTGLVSLDMTTLFVSASKLAERIGIANVLFNFHGEGAWKRMTIYSRLYPDAPTDRDFFAVEVTLAPGTQPDPEAAFADFAAHFSKLGLAEDLRLEGSTFLEDCYPMYHQGSDQLLDEALARVAQTGVVSIGRQGRFEYLPTSSGVIRRVLEELAKAGLAAPAPAPARVPA